MSVQVINANLMVSDICQHQGRLVGDGKWVVSHLPGRILSMENAIVALALGAARGRRMVASMRPIPRSPLFVITGGRHRKAE